MNDFALRACRYRDLDRVLALEEASFADNPYRRLDFVYFLEVSRGGFTIAEENDRLLGYVIAVGEEGEGFIQSIAVSPESRGRGVGDALMRSAVDHLVGYKQIRLLVDSNNAVAISLYRKFSFRETGKTIKGYYQSGDDALEMVRTMVSSGNRATTTLRERSGDA